MTERAFLSVSCQLNGSHGICKYRLTALQFYIFTCMPQKLITVTSYKGGCAKSTTSVHLAAFFSDRYHVLLIDEDPNHTSLEWAKRGQLPYTVADKNRAIKLIAKHDLIIVDTPARPESSDLKDLLEDCDMMILPTFPDILSYNPMRQTARDLEGIDAQARLKYRALVCNVPAAPNKEGLMMRDELQEEGIPVFQSLIRHTLGFQKAALEGVTINKIRNSKQRAAWQDYVKLGREIESLWKQQLDYAA
jgi:chromosome partitioning protein